MLFRKCNFITITTIDISLLQLLFYNKNIIVFSTWDSSNTFFILKFFFEILQLPPNCIFSFWAKKFCLKFSVVFGRKHVV